MRSEYREYIVNEIMFKYYALLIILAACRADTNVTTTCGKKEVSMSYLDIAIDMIIKTKNTFPECKPCHENAIHTPRDCADILRMGHNESGVFKIWPLNRMTEGKSLDVYCDMETNGGGWTLIQRRGNFQRKKDYFYKDWKSYKEGFGDIERDFWLGNDNIFALTNQKLYSARFDLEDVEHNKRYAQYDAFWIDDENSNYSLHISDFSGDAGDSMMVYHDNQKFSTNDRDNDNDKGKSCAEKYKGAWWYKDCYQANLNGEYHRGKYEGTETGVCWNSWKGAKESLESTEIKIRPKSFKLSYDILITPMK